MNKKEFEDRIEQTIENAATHFEERIESAVDKAEKRIEAAAENFNKSVDCVAEKKMVKIFIYFLNIAIAIGLIVGGFVLLHYEHMVLANICFIIAALDITWRIVEAIIFREKGNNGKSKKD